MRTVLAALDQGIALYDTRGAVLFVNAAAERLLGLTFEQLQDRAEIDPRWRALREDGTDYPREEHPHWVALHTGAPATAVMVTEAPDRAPAWVAVRAQPLFEGDTGKPTGAVASFTDITERRALDVALRESEERLRQTLAVTGAGTFSLRFTEGVMHFDTQMWALSGAPRPAGDLTLESAAAFVHPDDRARAQAVIAGALEPNGPASVVYEHRLAHAPHRWLSARAGVQRGADGRALRLVGTAVDVTEQKAAEAALREAQERLSAILASLEEGVLQQDAEGVLRFSNAAAERHLGLSAAQLSGRLSADPRWQAIDESGRELPGEEHPSMRALRSGKPVRGFVMGLHHPDGRLVWMSVNAQPMFLAEGRTPAGVVTSFSDITESRAAAEALRQREAEFRTLAEASPDAIFTTTPEGVVTYASPAMLRYTGLTFEQMVGGGFLAVIHPDDRERSMGEYARCLRAGEPYASEHRVHGTDGRYRWHQLRALPVRDAAGRIVKWVGTSVDVDALRNSQEELRQRADFEEKLIGIVGHDLRQPLQGIAMSAGLLLRRQELDARTLSAAGRISAAAARMQRMIRDILDFTQARVGTGIPIKRAPVDLAMLAHDAAQEAELANPARRVQLVHQGRGDGEWDADRLRQVLDNLLSNALAYSPPATAVRLEVDGQAEDSVTLRVHNEGAPIPPDVLPTLFQPMTRGVSVGGQQRSVGLGLFIVDHLVRAHGGEVKVTSAEVGTTFTVRLPRKRSAPENEGSFSHGNA
ncbi:Circadian input kinase A [Archangium gephyra]|uniref:histidine kinase n=1 Tax=Archangium gephyra TaxID=48 RepID=A0AAC8QC51_9BACT|nr:Circadian input kinase A [Archangium gephyra]